MVETVFVQFLANAKEVSIPNRFLAGSAFMEGDEVTGSGSMISYVSLGMPPVFSLHVETMLIRPCYTVLFDAIMRNRTTKHTKIRRGFLVTGTPRVRVRSHGSLCIS